MLTKEKVLLDRSNARNLGMEAAICKAAATEDERDQLREICKEAAATANKITEVFASGDSRRINQIKTAFINHGVPVSENAMSEHKEYSADLRKVAAEGLTPKKILTDRNNAFEMGVETFIEKVGMDEAAAGEFRSIAAQGLAELNENPERVKEALAQ